MNEIKKPRKSLAFYYMIAIIVIFLLNFLAIPYMEQRKVKQVDYSTFMTMTEKKQIGRVEVQDNQILFTNKEETQIFKTGKMDDSNLVERLHESGAQFASEIVEEPSLLMSILMSWVLPMVIFIFIGQMLTKKLMNKAGGNSMMFNMGKSNAKV